MRSVFCAGALFAPLQGRADALSPQQFQQYGHHRFHLNFSLNSIKCPHQSVTLLKQDAGRSCTALQGLKLFVHGIFLSRNLDGCADLHALEPLASGLLSIHVCSLPRISATGFGCCWPDFLTMASAHGGLDLRFAEVSSRAGDGLGPRRPSSAGTALPPRCAVSRDGLPADTVMFIVLASRIEVNRQSKEKLPVNDRSTWIVPCNKPPCRKEWHT